jgi:hypothetical protein
VILRRSLLALLVACAALGLTRQTAAGPEFYPPPSAETCPPGDRTDWYFSPTWRRADRIEWIVLPAPALYEVCQAWRHSAAIGGCAVTRPDYDFGGNRGIIYSLEPRERMAEWFVQHEECHTQGYLHGPHYF